MARLQMLFKLALISIASQRVACGSTSRSHGRTHGQASVHGSWLTASGRRLLGVCAKCTKPVISGGCRCNAKCECVYDWSTFGFNTARTGFNPYETRINKRTVAGLTKAWTYHLAGAPINQVMVVSGFRIQGALHDVAYVGDSAGIFHAVDATTGKLFWKRDLGHYVSPRCRDLPNNTFGVGGSAVVDRKTGRVYVAGGTARVYALNMATGSIAKGWGRAFFNYTHEFVYSALTLHPQLPILYVATAGYCDTVPYNGQVLAIDTVTGKQLAEFVPSLPFPGGGVWGSGGLSIDPVSGLVMTATGNSKANPQNAAYGEHVVSLNPFTLAPVRSFTPGVISPDGDFGATPVPFWPKKTCNRPLVSVQHKSGAMFVVDALSLELVQMLQISHVTGQGQFVGTAAWHPDRELLVLSNPADNGTFLHGVVAFRVASNCSLTVAWNSPVGYSSALRGNNVFSSPIIAGGVVYMAQGFQDVLWALDLNDGRVLWTANLTSAAFLPPTVINGKVYLAYGGWYNASSVLTSWALP